MFDQIVAIGNSIVASLLHIWPYLLVTIPLAVAVQMSGAARYITRAFQARPIVAIFLATAVGAFSPFCSCGVIPVVATLLIGGVPLAPVMSFWIASPSMDPEAFFLSVATLGWELAVWRLASTVVLSLGAGLLTHWIVRRGWLGESILRTQRTTAPGYGAVRSTWELLRAGARQIRHSLAAVTTPGLALVTATPGSGATCCGSGGASHTDDGPSTSPACSTSNEAGSGCAAGQGCGCGAKPEPFLRRLLRETWRATWMVVKFMALAFFLTALIKLYVPAEWVTGLLGGQGLWPVVTAALLGVPVYTSNLTALPMLQGLLAQGMSESAALAFLISGPVTTLPAMAAVWGLTSRRVFALYVGFALVGAIILGGVHSVVSALF